MSRHFQRGHQLYQQGRWSDAETELRAAIAENPNLLPAYAVLALTLEELERLTEAQAVAREAVRLDPGDAFAHYALGFVLCSAKKHKEATEHADATVRIDPSDVAGHLLKARIALETRDWNEALKWAESGLRLELDHIGCLNLRSMALTQLGRREEAGISLKAALAHRPDEASTHANMGWALLHKNMPKEAMNSFREALRLNPQMDWARQGIIEAIKAHNPIYRLMLMYFLWISRLGSNAMWGIIIGGMVFSQMLARVGDRYPEYALYTNILLGAYIAFALLTWIASPLFNLMLFVHPIGRHALSDEERSGSKWLGLTLIGAFASFAGFFAIQDWRILFFGLVCAIMLIPVGATVQVSAGGRNKWLFRACTAGLWGMGLLAAFVSPDWFMKLGIGILAFTLLVNAMAITRS